VAAAWKQTGLPSVRPLPVFSKSKTWTLETPFAPALTQGFREEKTLPEFTSSASIPLIDLQDFYFFLK
jgi:hypothetical protein